MICREAWRAGRCLLTLLKEITNLQKEGVPFHLGLELSRRELDVNVPNSKEIVHRFRDVDVSAT